MTGVLSDRAVIAVSGPDARTFLQGLITQDVRMLAPARLLYAALLTPQGKILFDFLLSERDSTIFLDCDAHSADRLLKRLTMYRLRAQVELTLRSDLAVIWNPAENGVGDPRWAYLGRRTVAQSHEPNVSANYLAERLAQGIPEGGDFGSDKMFALDAGLEELRGVSFDKGCYIGQELTARMKHRGTARKRLLPISAKDGSDLPSPGTEIQAGNVLLGEITATYGSRGFASIRLDRLEAIGAATPVAADQEVALIEPAWLTHFSGAVR